MWRMADLQQGDHIAHLYTCEEERWDILTAFLRLGLERGEKVIYAAGDHPSEEILLHLRERGLDLLPYIGSGQMMITPSIRLCEKEGRFDPDIVLRFFEEETALALQQGFSGLRVASEMEPVLQEQEEEAFARLLECEARKDLFLAQHPCLAFCQFDTNRFSPEILLHVLQSHPYLIIGRETYRNFYYIPSQKMKGPDETAARLRHWLEHLKHHKQIVEELRGSEERFTLAQRAAGITSWEWDVRAGTIFWSEVPAHAFGLSEKGAVFPAGQGKARDVFRLLFDRLHPEDRPQIIDALRRVMREGQLHPIEHRVLLQDGSIRWVEELGIVTQRDEKGRPLRITGIIRDVTSRKQAEEALRRHAQEQRALYAIASASSTSLGSSDFLPVVLDTLMPLMKADAGWILLPGPSLASPPNIVVRRGITDEVVEQLRLSPLQKCSHLFSALKERSGVLSSERCSLIPSELIDEMGLQRFVCTALQAEGELMGLMTLAWREPRVLSRSDRTLLKAVGHQVGMALRNIMLYRVARQEDQIRAVQVITTAITSSLDLDIVLRRLLQAICKAVRADGGGVVLFAEGTTTPEFALRLVRGEFSRRNRSTLRESALLARILRHPEATRIDDVYEDDRIADLVDELTARGIRSLAYVPMKYHGETIGMLVTIGERKGAFTDQDLDLLKAVSPVAAVAVENARLYTSAQERMREMRALNQIGLVLATTLDYEAVTRSALHQIQALFEAAWVVLFEVSEQGEVRFVHSMSEGERIEAPIRIAPGREIAEWIAANRQPLLLKDALLDSRWVSHPEEQRPRNVRALMAVPLTASGQVIGVVEVGDGEPGFYTRNELRVLETLAPTLAAALENARLFERQKQLLEERKRTRAWLIHSDKIAALGKMTASIAHEINNPLQAVQGCITLLREELEGKRREEKLERYLGIAESEIARLSGTVRRFRDFYRSAREEKQLVDLHAVLKAVLDLTRKQLQQGGIVVRREWATDLPSIEANPDYLRHLFLNLILNAIDAMPAGGTLSIRTSLEPMETPEEEKSLPAVRIDLTDTGVGMSPEVLEHLFDPFFTTKEGGTGLGLSISREIVQAHGGRIVVRSREGEGTTFSLWLPLGGPSEPSASSIRPLVDGDTFLQSSSVEEQPDEDEPEGSTK